MEDQVRILVVDDDPGFRQLMTTILAGEGYAVDAEPNVAGARRACAQSRYQVVLSDLRLPDGDGLDVQKWFSENAPGTAFALLTGFGTVASAVEAMIDWARRGPRGARVARVDAAAADNEPSHSGFEVRATC